MILTSLLNYYYDELMLVDRENYDKSNVNNLDSNFTDDDDDDDDDDDNRYEY